MINKSQLPYLINLLDDDDPEIRSAVLRDLSSFGYSLENEILKMEIPIDEKRMSLLSSLLKKLTREKIEQDWKNIFKLGSEYLRIERTMELIAQYQSHSFRRNMLSEKLDSLANEFKEKYPFGDAFDLSTFLFRYKRLRGAATDYYSPQNINLIFVLEEKIGIPLSLAIIYMLVGFRVGMNIDGCNMPGHFLARFSNHGDLIFVDCFNGGKFFHEEDFYLMKEDLHESLEKILNKRADSLTIIKRALSNLILAYERSGENEHAKFFEMLQNNL